MKDVFVHPSSDVKAENIGEGTKIWQYCVVFADATVVGNPARIIR